MIILRDPVTFFTMGVYTKLPAELTQVDVIIVGGESNTNERVKVTNIH